MTGAQSGKARDLQKPFPGCMGRMVGVFEPRGTKMLTEKAHLDASSPINRNRVEPVKMDTQISNRVVSPSPSKRIDGMQMSLLLAQEMSKSEESKRMPSNVVARLMGLDALPNQQTDVNAKISSNEDFSLTAGTLQCNEDSISSEIQSCAQEGECKVVHEMQRKSSKGGDKNTTENKMKLVRQKFLEAKSLATDEKLIRSKEFQDALEVLSSNRDLFVKVLDDPNSLFSKHLQEFQTLRPLPQPRRITVLKPARMVESKVDEQVSRHQHPSAEANLLEMNKHHWSSGLVHQRAGSISQSTRIVVLKPNIENLREIKNMAVCSAPSPEMLAGRDSCVAIGSGEVASDEAAESREEAKESTQQSEESLNSNRTDETFVSAVLSNGYVGDDSSLNVSEIEEDGCNFSDLEIATPTSRHSWCYTNRSDHLRSVLSSSCASRAESSVIREAKKRLSERCAMVTSSGVGHGQRQDQSSSTLGEMLAIPVEKKDEWSDWPADSSSRPCGGYQGTSSNGGTFAECSGEKSPRSLSRTKSVPISALFCGGNGAKDEVPMSLINILPKSILKLKSGKMSLKDKVSSMFLSKMKKTGGEKFILGPLASSDEDSARVNHEKKSGSNGNNGSSTRFAENALPLKTSGKSMENQDQPSPISVLEATFNDDVNIDDLRSSIAGNPQVLSRSPLIGSLARSLSRDNTCFQASLPKTKNKSTLMSKEDRFVFVHKLLSSAGIDGMKSTTVLAQWHSLDSPLDPMLLEGFLPRKEEEAKCRARRSNQKLLFDCVNTALSDIDHRVLELAYPWARVPDGRGIRDASVTDIVWRLISDWSSVEDEWSLGEANTISLVVDGMVKREVEGRERVDICEFGNELGGKLLDDLIEAALTEMTGKFVT